MQRPIRFLIFIAILLNSLNLPPSFQPAEAAAEPTAIVQPSETPTGTPSATPTATPTASRRAARRISGGGRAKCTRRAGRGRRMPMTPPTA